jgi:F-box protein 21
VLHTSWLCEEGNVADLRCRVHDNSTRYVAEENVEVLEVVEQSDVDAFPIAVGKFFKRWDGEKNVFVSNVRDEYPED